MQEENAKGDDVERALDATGWTPRKFRRARLRWSLSEAEFETALANTNAAEAVDKAFDREALRIIRVRREVERLCLTDHERARTRSSPHADRAGRAFGLGASAVARQPLRTP